jgi:hypothetical protein
MILRHSVVTSKQQDAVLMGLHFVNVNAYQPDFNGWTALWAVSDELKD